ncbi:MAG: LCP family protein [Candidatus Saccharibacteria bacterium]|nr:LCP family protein [Candidatus Saccharibacteria bacterium]
MVNKKSKKKNLKRVETSKKIDKPSFLNLNTTKIISFIFSLILIIFIARISLASLLPAKFFWPLVIGLVAFLGLFFYFAFKRNVSSKTSLVLVNLFAVVLSVGMVYSGLKINELSDFINRNFEDNKSYAVYNLIVKKDAEINSPEELKNKEIFTYEEPVKEISNSKLTRFIEDRIPGASLEYKEDLSTVMERASKLSDVASLASNGTYESYISVNSGYEDEIKIIATYKIEIDGKVEEEEPTSANLSNTPFILYINGIDTRTDGMPSRSLADVNILAAVNPNTKKILLVAIPRDTYVQLSGTTGLMDKLTHAGSRGGVALSKATIEDFMGITIDRYIRVNFNFVKGLVDGIGGITVTNDLDRTLTLDGCTYNPGDNFVDGKCALRFARERKSYSTGDRHRGENQEQVITRILEKVSISSSLIKNYSTILSSLNDYFDTNVSSADIAALVRMQLNDMSSWAVESYNINGTGAMAKTYSYPNQNLYVMMPDVTTVATAKNKISALLSE